MRGSDILNSNKKDHHNSFTKRNSTFVQSQMNHNVQHPAPADPESQEFSITQRTTSNRRNQSSLRSGQRLQITTTTFPKNLNLTDFIKEAMNNQIETRNLSPNIEKSKSGNDTKLENSVGQQTDDILQGDDSFLHNSPQFPQEPKLSPELQTNI